MDEDGAAPSTGGALMVVGFVGGNEGSLEGKGAGWGGCRVFVEAIEGAGAWGPVRGRGSLVLIALTLFLNPSPPSSSPRCLWPPTGLTPSIQPFSARDAWIERWNSRCQTWRDVRTF